MSFLTGFGGIFLGFFDCGIESRGRRRGPHSGQEGSPQRRGGGRGGSRRRGGGRACHCHKENEEHARAHTNAVRRDHHGFPSKQSVNKFDKRRNATFCWGKKTFLFLCFVKIMFRRTKKKLCGSFRFLEFLFLFRTSLRCLSLKQKQST
jgi:hypothetical protein